MPLSEHNDPLHPVNCIGNAIRKASRAASSYYEGYLRPADLRFTQFSVLVAIRELGDPSVQELASVTRIDRTTLTRTLGRMKKSDLVALLPGSDRRERHVRLTEEGRGRLIDAEKRWLEAQEHVRSVVGDEEMAVFQRVLHEVDRLSDQGDPNGG